VSILLPRFTNTRLEDERKIARVILDGTETPAPEKNPKRELAKPGDPRVLRAIPVIARGVGGTVPGTDPLGALLTSDHRTRYARVAQETPVKIQPCTP